MRFLLYLLLFFIVYYIIKVIVKSISSSPKTTIHNSRMRKKENSYDNVEDAQYTEIKSGEEKKNNK